MNTKIPAHLSYPFRHGYSAAIFLFSALAVTAQSAANFNTSAIAPAQPQPSTAAAPGKSTVAPPADFPPSRFVSELDREAHLRTLVAAFAISARATDPFALYQDPAAKPAAPVIKATRRQPVRATPFSEIVKHIRITTVMPSNGGFMVGSRSFQTGDSLPLNFRSKSYRAQVTAVSAAKVSFKNPATGETADVTLDLMPAGMSRGNPAISAPGMVRNQDAPLELEPAESAQDTSSRPSP